MMYYRIFVATPGVSKMLFTPIFSRNCLVGFGVLGKHFQKNSIGS